jgi:hypothetical protein
MPGNARDMTEMLHQRVDQQQKAYEANPKGWKPPNEHWTVGSDGKVRFVHRDPLTGAQKLFVAGTLAFAGAGLGAAIAGGAGAATAGGGAATAGGAGGAGGAGAAGAAGAGGTGAAGAVRAAVEGSSAVSSANSAVHRKASGCASAR